MDAAIDLCTLGDHAGWMRVTVLFGLVFPGLKASQSKLWKRNRGFLYDVRPGGEFIWGFLSAFVVMFLMVYEIAVWNHGWLAWKLVPLYPFVGAFAIDRFVDFILGLAYRKRQSLQTKG